MSLLRSPRVVGLLVALTALLVYIRTLAPSTAFIDAGELSAVTWSLGIAHPSGYPLFTLLGWCFAHLPLPVAPVVRVNLMAALFCAAGVFVFFQVVAIFARRCAGDYSQRSEPLVLAASAGASLLLAFSETYWSQAVSVEVYSLHVLLLGCILLAFLNANVSRDASSSAEPVGTLFPSDRRWAVFAFTVGLGFTNHLTTMLLAPALVTLYFVEQRWNARSWRRIGAMVLPFLLGLSVYAYLPLRASQQPELNWGDPVTLERFLNHVSGKQFRVWIFSSTEVAGRQIRYFLQSLPLEHAYVGLALAVVGVIVLWRRARRLAILTIVLFFSCVLYAINYDIYDIDSYFLLAYVTVALWAGCALVWVGSRARDRWKWGTSQAAVLLVALGLVGLPVHFNAVDESKNTLVEDYTKNMFASLQPAAIVLSFQWDYWVSSSYYRQIVLGERPDLVVIDKELLRRSWYLTQLERRYPWLMERSRAELEGYRVELAKFEHDLPYEPAVIQARYVSLISSFISRNIASRPVYVTSEIQPEFTRGFQRAPEGLAQRLYADTLFHPTPAPTYEYRPFSRRGRLEDVVRRLYAESYGLRGEYYLRWGDAGEAENAFRIALSYDPSYAVASQWLSRLPRRGR
jgi:hypothetical protein